MEHGGAIAVLAAAVSWRPGFHRRASKVDPMRALRYD